MGRPVIPFDPPGTGLALVDRVIALLRTTLQSLKNAVTNDNIVTVVFTTATTDVQVFHGLEEPPVSWEVIDLTADANVWRSTTVNNRPRSLIILQASAPVTARVRFA